MKTLSLWIRPEALTNGQIKEKACNEYMNIMEVTGKNVLYPDMPKGFHALLLFLTEGEISFVMKEEKIVVIAPACIDFVFISQLNDVKTSENFKGTLIITDQIFFKKATEAFRFSLSKVIYYYSQKPFVLFTQQEIERVTQLTGFLENIIKQKEHRFNNDMVRNFLQSILYEIWNEVLCTFDDKINTTEYIEDDLLGDFFYLVHTHCRKHHHVKWYAEQLCISSDALSSRLRKIYGKNASQLIDETLLTDAKLCLLEPRATIQSVSELLCFADQASFCNFFKRCSGISPSEFRKSRMS